MVVLRLLAVAGMVSGLVVAGAGTACACTCAELPPAESVRQSAAVFTATVVSVRPEKPAIDEGQVTATLRADHVYKGGRQALIKVSTPAQSPACGYSFERGARYLVFAKKEQGRLTTMLCSGNRRVPAGTRALRAGDGTGMDEISQKLIKALGDPGPLISAKKPKPRPDRKAEATSPAPEASAVPEPAPAVPSPVPDRGSPQVTPPAPGMETRAHSEPAPAGPAPGVIAAAAGGSALAIGGAAAFLTARRRRR
ncbi:hypothetical protein C1I98_08200 [Spongiactinospora gelatinilytica]|uniref:Tissue inhibitor of metalloproteinase n=1 Tax=Spongiactinospora gelatinilytica TaxID=2666298 RepID=A0A2W2GV38_9ACTN|nr:hypothetical protein [Spongiactinospora gelatinilytica]PZG51543.1 hypothetical protein C1I98_08200 [Spongiactinospora gelatinilytica]